MGFKQDLIDAKVKAARDSGAKIPLDTSNGSFIEREAEYTKDAIVKFLTQAEFRITQLNAPVVVEKLKTPDQIVNIKLETLLGDKAPILSALKKLPIPAISQIVNSLESELEKAITPLLAGGADLVGLDLGKGDSDNERGGLESTGYVFIGEDPDSQEEFDVTDEDGQREFTTVKLIREDIEDLL